MDTQFLDMADMANKMLHATAKAQTLSAPITPATHGYDIAAMEPAERTGYAKAMLDMIDWLARKGNPILHVAQSELRDYRNQKLNAGPQ